MLLGPAPEGNEKPKINLFPSSNESYRLPETAKLLKEVLQREQLTVDSTKVQVPARIVDDSSAVSVNGSDEQIDSY